MEIVKYIVMAIYAVVCVALVVLVLKQNKEDSGASGTIVGASANNFYVAFLSHCTVKLTSSLPTPTPSSNKEKACNHGLKSVRYTAPY